MRFEVLTVVTATYSLLGHDIMKFSRPVKNISQEPVWSINIYHITWQLQLIVRQWLT
jgi:hypothetical protein